MEKGQVFRNVRVILLLLFLLFLLIIIFLLLLSALQLNDSRLLSGPFPLSPTFARTHTSTFSSVKNANDIGFHKTLNPKLF
jgi:hypothetical protein